MKGYDLVSRLAREDMPDLEQVREICHKQTLTKNQQVKRLRWPTAAVVATVVIILSTTAYAAHQHFSWGERHETMERALGAEMEQLLKNVNGITHANVYISLPEQWPDHINGQFPLTNVVITTSRDFSNDEISAIVLMLTRTVNGLDIENIVIKSTNDQIYWPIKTNEE